MLDREIGMPGSSSAAISAIRRSCSPLAKALISEMASAWIPLSLQLPQPAPGFVLVERGDHGAVAGDPFRDLDGVLQRGQRFGFGPDDPAGQAARHERPGDLQHLPEALGGHQPDDGALALQDRVGADGGAVQHLRDLGVRDTGVLADLSDPAEHTDRLILRRGRGFRPPGFTAVGVHQQHVGERAADIDAEPETHGSSWCGALGLERGQITDWSV